MCIAHENIIYMSFFSAFSKKNYLFIIYISLFLVSISTSFAQELVITPFLKNKDFQDVEFYNFLEDTKGFLWIGSNHGVFKYDGSELLNYTKKDSTFFYDVLNIFEDKNGGIWLVTFQKGLIYFDYTNNEFEIPEWNNDLTELLGKNWVSNLFIAPDNSLWLQKFAYNKDSIIDFFQIRDNTIIAHQFSAKKNLALFFKENNLSLEQQQLFKVIQQQLSLNRSSLSVLSLDSLFNALDKKNMVNYNRLFPTRDKNDPNHIFRKIIKIDSSSFLGLGYNGFSANPFALTHKYFLPKYQINDIYKLSDGQYLFSTNRNGILKCPSMAIKRHSISNTADPVVSSYVANNCLYIKTQKNIYKKTSTFSRPELVLTIDPSYNSINSLETFVVWDSTIVINNLAFHKKAKQHLFPLNIRNKLKGRSKSIQVIKDSLLLFTSATGFIFLDKNLNLLTNSKNLGYNSWTYTANIVDTNKIWFGSINGVVEYNYKRQNLTPIPLSDQELEIKTIKGHKKTGVFIGTQRNGLFIFTPNHQFIKVTGNKNLSSDHIRTILLENDTIAWVGTKNGISKVIFSPHSSNIEVSSYLTGILIDNLNLFGDHIFAINNGELISFPKNMPPLNTKVSSILITNLNINGVQHKPKKGNINLKRHENNIQIFYRKPNFKNNVLDTFSYALLSENDIDTVWKQTTDFSISFLLNPGQYTFLLTTKEGFSSTASIAQSLTIRIQKHFTDTIYFSLLIYLLSLLGVSSVAYIIIRTTKNRVELQKNLVESQLKLLRTQMNPHFLFNTLNSIVGYITEKNIWKATKYMSKFSQLVRNILESSKESFLPLGDEIKMLQDYIFLEKMRLGEKYTIQIKQKTTPISSLFYIPPMFIQPFIENAIIHGITPNGSGTILVTFEQYNDQTLKITIQDDGVGRKKSMQKPKNFNLEAKESIGIANVYDRISIINKTYKINIQLSIHDLYHPTGEAKGTAVQILLPLSKYLEQKN